MPIVFRSAFVLGTKDLAKLLFLSTISLFLRLEESIWKWWCNGWEGLWCRQLGTLQPWSFFCWMSFFNVHMKVQENLRETKAESLSLLVLRYCCLKQLICKWSLFWYYYYKYRITAGLLSVTPCCIIFRSSQYIIKFYTLVRWKLLELCR